MNSDKFWATTAITLGAWETSAVMTRRLPTITKACQLARRRYRKKAELAIGVWLIGLGWHLLRREA